jgi:periplasmic protein TonB
MRAGLVSMAAVGLVAAAVFGIVRAIHQNDPQSVARASEQSTPPAQVAEVVTSREPVKTPAIARPEKTRASARQRANPPAPPANVQASLQPRIVPTPHGEAVETPEPPKTTAIEPNGKLFERSDVDESPRVVNRVEPKLPANLKAIRNDVVVVRVLVSQSGHPFRVSLLRGSRLGRSLDDAVVAAVTKWTFMPAKRKGEAVSCWLNFGVPLVRAD